MVRTAVICTLLGVASLAPVSARADVTLTTANSCYHVGDLITVEVHKGATASPVVGGQIFLTYDNSVAQYIGGTGGDPPFTFEVLDHVSGSSIDYAIGVPGAGAGVAADAVIARLVFKAQQEVCGDASFLTLRTHNPPSRLTDNLGNEVPATFHDLGTAITIDSSAPVVTCQMDQNVPSDPGGCTHTFMPFPGPSVLDNCPTTLTAVRSDNAMLTPSDPFPVGDTTIVWTATDCSGNVGTCTQHVVVSASNVLNVTLQEPNIGTGTRCITLELYTPATCPGAPAYTLDTPMSFVAGTATGSFNIPCGDYSCIQARDKLHSIRRTADPAHFTSGGGVYTASFVDSSMTHLWNAAGNDALLAGNLNDDQFIDILDYGVFLTQVFTNYGFTNTTCSTPAPHADFNFSGVVDTFDFTFISVNFLATRDADCCGVDLVGAQPTTDISVFELAARSPMDYQVARTADLNHDGRLNLEDIAFLSDHGLPLCQADFDGDHALAVSDIFVFLNSWFAQHPAADFNNDHSVNTTDIFAFLNAWFAGCN